MPVNERLNTKITQVCYCEHYEDGTVALNRSMSVYARLRESVRCQCYPHCRLDNHREHLPLHRDLVLQHRNAAVQPRAQIDLLRRKRKRLLQTPLRLLHRREPHLAALRLAQLVLAHIRLRRIYAGHALRARLRLLEREHRELEERDAADPRAHFHLRVPRVRVDEERERGAVRAGGAVGDSEEQRTDRELVGGVEVWRWGGRQGGCRGCR